MPKRRKAPFPKVVVLKASGGGKSLTLEPRDPDQNIRSQTILFPSTSPKPRSTSWSTPGASRPTG